MAAFAARADVVGCSMNSLFAHHEKTCKPLFRTFVNELRFGLPHNPNMARRGIPKGPLDWYLVEWMEACGLTGRGSQAKMRELTGWSAATMSQLYNGTQNYSPKVVNEAARALNVEVFELFMPPERAMHLRKMRETAISIAAEEPVDSKDKGLPLRAVS